MTTNQWHRTVRDICRPLGYRIDGLTNGGHLRLRHRTARTCFTSATPSDFRAAKNLRSQLRRAVMEATCNAKS